MAVKTTFPGVDALRPPPCDGLDIAAFSLVFRNTTTSHKFLWGRALLRSLKKNGFQSCEISLPSMAAGMLDAARRPVCVFRLRLSKDDKIDKLWFPELESMPHWNKRMLTRLKDGDIFLRRSHNIPREISEGLTTYASHLFMSPFFGNSVKGLAGPPKFRKIRALAKERFDGELPPPYRFSGAGGAIIVHPKWAQYISRNFEILDSWIMWELARHLQQINPSIPAIVSKLDAKAAPNTTRQKNFWRRAMARRPGRFHCIYTGEAIADDNFVLDHYIPWSFVAHDNMWNLVPVSDAGNEAKSDNLPDSGEYFNHFVNMQHIAVQSLHAFPDKTRWDDIFEPYLTDLNLDAAQAAADKSALSAALAGTIEPLLSIAKTRNFAHDWVFGKR